VQDLIEAQDLNALLRAVDSACEARLWDQLVELADRCDAAIERGKQLWPISAHIDYRLALEAPGEHAAAVLHPDVGRFSLGPLTEVAASTHRWEELAPHIEVPQMAAYVAQERVLRGEALVGDDRAHPEVLELPLYLQSWEPTYTLATFRSSFVEIAEPWGPRAPLLAHERCEGRSLEDPELVDALLDLVAPWTAESNGAARAVVVEGTAASAVSALTLDGFRMGRLTVAEAIQRLAWAAGSGGAHGRRRGAALGRFLAWYVGALLVEAPWPPDPDDLGRALARFRWYRWDEGADEAGWVLRVAVEHSDGGWAAAIAATDVLGSDDDAAGRGPPA
jgi:hypothetical protein